MINELRPGALEIMRACEGRFADSYVAESLVPALRDGLRCPVDRLADARPAALEAYSSLRLFYWRYAFAKRGKERRELAKVACDALDRLVERNGLEALLMAPDARSLWNEFCAVCALRGVHTTEQLNRGVIAGVAEIAQELYREDGVGSIGRWVWQEIVTDRRVESCFLRFVDVRGVGPKTTAMLLRDLVCVFDLESRLEHSDRIYIQPIDRWLRSMAAYVAYELQGDHVADWVVAGKLAKYTRRAGISGARFNMGASFYGSRIVRERERVGLAIDDLLNLDLETDRPPKPGEGRLW